MSFNPVLRTDTQLSTELEKDLLISRQHQRILLLEARIDQMKKEIKTMKQAEKESAQRLHRAPPSPDSIPQSALDVRDMLLAEAREEIQRLRKREKTYQG